MVISSAERQFIFSTLLGLATEDGTTPSVPLRADGRKLMQGRPVTISFPGGNTSVLGEQTSKLTEERSSIRVYGRTEVMVGDSTMASACVTADLVRPYPDRPAEGFCYFSVDVTRCAAASNVALSNDIGAIYAASEDLAVACHRAIEKAVKGARAVDVESLVVEPGESVWALRVDIRILSNGGSAVDCAGMAAIAALLHFRHQRKVETSTSNDAQGDGEASLQKLGVSHLPLPVSFAFFDPAAAALMGLTSAKATDAKTGAPGKQHGHDRVVCVIDPTREEELASQGTLTLVVNEHEDLCGMHTGGNSGLELDPETLLGCVAQAAKRASTIARGLRDLANADVAGTESAAGQSKQSVTRIGAEQKDSKEEQVQHSLGNVIRLPESVGGMLNSAICKGRIPIGEEVTADMVL